MQEFGTAEVARLAGIPAGAIRSMIRARYVSPRRGPRGALRFTFQDLVLLRTARELLAARLSSRRIGAALRAIRAKLPEHIPARGLSVAAMGDRVIVHEAGGKHEAHSGQLLLALEVHAEGGTVRLIDASGGKTAPQAAATVAAAAAADECDAHFEAALALEETDVSAAVDAYQACVARHAHRGAVANLGRLLHLQGRVSDAVALYRSVSDADTDILYNLAVALEDLGETDEARDVYLQVLSRDAAHGDAHHNVARLYQEAGEVKRALRHWNAWRRLQRLSGPPGGDPLD